MNTIGLMLCATVFATVLICWLMPLAGSQLASAGSGFTPPRLVTLSTALPDEVNRETAEPVPTFMMRAGHGCQAGAPVGLSSPD